MVFSKLFQNPEKRRTTPPHVEKRRHGAVFSLKNRLLQLLHTLYKK